MDYEDDVYGGAYGGSPYMGGSAEGLWRKATNSDPMAIGFLICMIIFLVLILVQAGYISSGSSNLLASVVPYTTALLGLTGAVAFYHGVQTF